MPRGGEKCQNSAFVVKIGYLECKIAKNKNTTDFNETREMNYLRLLSIFYPFTFTSVAITTIIQILKTWVCKTSKFQCA